jgi:hypothetical protein
MCCGVHLDDKWPAFCRLVLSLHVFGCIELFPLSSSSSIIKKNLLLSYLRECLSSQIQKRSWMNSKFAVRHPTDCLLSGETHSVMPHTQKYATGREKRQHTSLLPNCLLIFFVSILLCPSEELTEVDGAWPSVQPPPIPHPKM